MRLTNAFVKEEQNSAERVKNTVQFGKPISIMKFVGTEIMKGVLKKAAAVATAALSTAMMSAPTFTTPTQAQSQPNVQAIAKRLEPEYINLLTAPEYSGKTVMTRQPVTDSLYEVRTGSSYTFAFMAGPGPLTVDVLKRPNSYSTTRIGYYSEDLKCKDFLGVNYTDRGDCYLSRRQPILMIVAFSHDRGKQQTFQFRVRGYSGIIGPQNVDNMIALSQKISAETRPAYKGDATPGRRRFCSKANGYCF